MHGKIERNLSMLHAQHCRLQLASHPLLTLQGQVSSFQLWKERPGPVLGKVA